MQKERRSLCPNNAAFTGPEGGLGCFFIHFVVSHGEQICCFPQAPAFLQEHILDIRSFSSQPAPGKSGLDETTTPRTTWKTELPGMGHWPPDLVQWYHGPEAVYSQRHGNPSVLLLKATLSSSNTQSTFSLTKRASRHNNSWDIHSHLEHKLKK